MPANTFTTVRYEQPYGAEGAGTITYMHGPEAFFRDPLDARRSMQYQTPESQYPDGYLGTITSRRDDRLLNALAQRQNQKAYQRGVHKGERIDQGDYFWNRTLDPMSGVQRAAAAVYVPEQGYMVQRFQPDPSELEMHLVNDGKIAPVAQAIRSVQPGAESLRRMAPSWRV